MIDWRGMKETLTSPDNNLIKQSHAPIPAERPKKSLSVMGVL